MSKREQYKDWNPEVVASEGYEVAVVCITDDCNEALPEREREKEPDHEYAEAWMSFHLMTTGHTFYSRTVHDALRWHPPTGVDPETVADGTT
ncbi:hypothetical protein [Streptomyces uncialis]|uniref:hypothetical protein n=1 Tax=Streptomyces uncialis TaxID=1048205 RepID=UPI000AC36B40|nr:hypothetical protein [Streptomyces uncialis]